MTQPNQTTTTYLTKSGVQLTLLMVSPHLISMVRESVALPERPTYEIQTVAGNVERHAHDGESVTSPTELQTWRAYNRALDDARARRNEVVIRAFLIKGVEVDLPKDDSWIATQKALGLEVPTNPYDLKVHWLKTEALLPHELQEVCQAIMALGRTREEEVKAAEDSFRGAVGESERAGTEQPEPIEQ